MPQEWKDRISVLYQPGGVFYCADEKSPSDFDVVQINSGETRIVHADGFQLCPKCGGEGFVSNPMLTVSHQTCPVCEGKMIISKATGRPPI